MKQSDIDSLERFLLDAAASVHYGFFDSAEYYIWRALFILKKEEWRL